MRNPVWRRVPEGSDGSWGWGVVRDDIFRRKVIEAPIPLHWIFRYGERAYWWIAFKAGLKKRLDCPCCGQRFDRFRWNEEKALLDRIAALEPMLDALRARNRMLFHDVSTLAEANLQHKLNARAAMELYPEVHVCFPGEPLP